MIDRLTKFIRPRWMLEAPPETHRELSLDDPQLLSVLWQWAGGGFVPDGGLRDIRARDVGPAEWNALIAHLRKSGRSLTCRVGEVEQDLDRLEFTSLLKQRQEESVLLSVEFDGHRANTHFFDDTEIEFDIDPRDVGEANFASLVGFMVEVSAVVGRPVTLTDEGDKDDAHLFKIDIARRLVIVPVPPYVSDVVGLPDSWRSRSDD